MHCSVATPRRNEIYGIWYCSRTYPIWKSKKACAHKVHRTFLVHILLNGRTWRDFSGTGDSSKFASSSSSCWFSRGPSSSSGLCIGMLVYCWPEEGAFVDPRARCKSARMYNLSPGLFLQDLRVCDSTPSLAYGNQRIQRRHTSSIPTATSVAQNTMKKKFATMGKEYGYFTSNLAAEGPQIY